MNDKDFDKIFGDKLREERAFKTQDSNWEPLSTRLDMAQKAKKDDNRRRGAAWLWLLFIPILALLLWQMNDLRHQNKQLAAQIIDLQSHFVAYTLQHDTIVQKVQKTDTVIIYKYLPTIGKTSLKNNTSLLPKYLISNNTQNVAQQDTIVPKSLNEERKIAELTEKLADLDKQITNLAQALSENMANMARLADCANNQNSLKKQLGEAIVFADSLKKQTRCIETPKVDKPMKNNRLFIGFQGGNIKYKTTWKNAVGVNVYKNFDSYQAGLKLEYALTDKVRLTAGGDFCPFSFLIYWQDKRYNLPSVQFDPLKEKYLNAESKQTLLQGNIGAKYFFTEGGAKWRPFVSAAYSMMHIKPFQTKFTYQPLWGTTNREQIVPSAAINIPNLLLLSGGLEYRFSKYGVAQVEAFYDKDVNKIHQTFDLFGLRMAVLLNLK